MKMFILLKKIRNYLIYFIKGGVKYSKTIGVKVGDKWCLCALRFKEAYENNAAPKVILEATNEKTLNLISMDVLIEHAFYSQKS